MNPANRDSKSPFENHSAEYDQWFDSESGSAIFSLELGCLKQALEPQMGSWLEIGVGSGRFADALGIETGIDPSPAMVAMAAKRGINVSLASGENLPFEDTLFDGAVMVCTICFLADPGITLRECHRVLKRDGRLIIGVIPADSPWGIYHSRRGGQGHTFYSSARFYTASEIRILAKSNGFTFLAEHGCILPKPDDAFFTDDISRQTLREESFVALSFIKRNNQGGKQE